MRLIAAFGLAAALAALLAGLATLYGATGRPWTGLPMFANATLGTRVFAAPEVYPLLDGVLPQTRLTAVNGHEIADTSELARLLQNQLLRAPTELTLRQPDGSVVQRTIELRRFDAPAALTLYLPLMTLGLLLLGSGITPVLAQPHSPAARALAVVTTGVSASFAFLLPDFFLGHRFTPASFAFFPAAQAGLLHFGLEFPRRRWPLTRWPRTVLSAIYGTSIVFWILFAAGFEQEARFVFLLTGIQVASLGFGFAVLLANLAYTGLRDPAPRLRHQAKITAPALGLLGLSGIALGAATLGRIDYFLPPALYIFPLPLVVLSFAYGVLNSEMFALDAFARRLLARGALAVSVLALFCVLLAFLALILSPGATWTVAALLTLTLTTALPLLTPLYERIQSGIESALFPQQRRLREALQDTVHEIGRLRDTAGLAHFLKERISGALDGAPVHLMLEEEDGSLREAAPRSGTMRLSWEPSDPLTAILRSKSSFHAGRASKHSSRQLAAARCAELDIELMVPLPIATSRAAGLVLGPRPNRRLYDRDDLKLLESLAAPLGLAIDNARRLDEIEALRQRLEGENLYLREEAREDIGPSGIIGESPQISRAIEQLQRVARNEVSVLIIGETGTGKEMAVRILHAASARTERALVKLACAALPENLLESELFGHERGAFTGADRSREGRFEVADGGILFFDDVDTLSLAVQAKLLRALQEGEVQRLGSNTVRKVDVRIVATTNRDLEEEVRAGRFREDLYYRLAVVPIRLPPLREREGDIPILVEHLVRTEAQRLGREIREVASEALAEMTAYDWPGNVRELRNVVERAIVLETGPILHLPGPLGGAGPKDAAPSRISPDALARGAVGAAPLKELLGEYKRALIETALRNEDGNLSRAAEVLGLHRPSLSRMVRNLGLRDD